MQVYIYKKMVFYMKEIVRGSNVYQINPNNCKLFEFTAMDGTKSYMVTSGSMNLQITEQEYNNFKS